MKTKTMRSLLLAGALFLGTVLAGLQTVAVYADEDYAWNVTFTPENKMESTFSSDTVAEALSGIQPGDSVTFTVALKNTNSQETKWYMKNEILATLEESATAARKAGGAYTYVLSYRDSAGNADTIFSSDTVGGESYVNENITGLKEIGDSINKDEWFYLMDLANGKGGTVELQVALDGETQGNAYQDTLARIELQFAVELPTTSSASATTTPEPNKTTNAVKTGDASRMLLYAVLAGVAGVILLILAVVGIKNRKKEEKAAIPLQEEQQKGGRR